MKVGIITSDKYEWHIRNLKVELEKRSTECYIFPINRLVSKIGFQTKVEIKGYSVDDYDALIIRRVPGGSPEQVFYRMDVLHFLEDIGVYVINPSDAIEKSVDKYYSSALLEFSGLIVPRTIVCEGFNSAIRGFDELGGDVILKPIFGSLGIGMTRISDRDIAYRVFRALERIGSVYYLQEFVPHNCEDIRCFVVGDQVIASMVRRADNWKTNISGGGLAVAYEPKDEIIEASLKAKEVMGLEYTGIDLLTSEEGETYLVEVNSTPGWRGLQSVTDRNIAESIVTYIIERLKR